MAEVGLLPFARVALQVATQVLPPYRTRFSKHQFTQPQLLAVLCLMRFEDWTFREAEVRLREHQELRAVLHLPAVPDYTTLYRFLRRLGGDTGERGFRENVAAGRRYRRSWIAGNRAAAAAPPEPAHFCGHRWYGALRYFRQHFLPPTPGATCPRTPAASSLVEVVDRRGCAAADFVGAAGSSGAGVRHTCFAGVARCGGPRRSDRYGARGCGV